MSNSNSEQRDHNRHSAAYYRVRTAVRVAWMVTALPLGYVIGYVL